MRIVILESSPNRHGSSNLLAERFAQGAQEAGHQVAFVDVAHADIHPCTGCVHCGYEGPCVQKDDVEGIRRQLLAADMVVFVTPLYYYGMSAQLKTMVDRFCAFNSSLQAKHLKSALLAAAWNSDSWTFAALEAHYQTLVRYLNLQDMGMVLGTGCGTPAMTARSPFPRGVVDLLMTLGLWFLMGYHLWGERAHEWVGAGTLALFLVHHLLNRRWYPALARGPWTVLRRLTALVNGLLLLDMAGLLVSGVLLSNHVFAFLGLTGGTGTVRLVHMAASHWGFLLMSFHLGLHWGGVLARGRRWLALPPPSPRRARIGTLLGAAVAVYGLTVFFRRDFPTYLFLRSQFVFLDFSESPLVFYGDHLALMGTFVFLGWALARRRGKGSA